MIPDTRTPEEIAQDFRWARPIRKCPGCGELAATWEFSRLDSFYRPFGDTYPETGVARGYCANCDAFLEVWGRGKGDDRYEIGCRMWRWNPERTSLTSRDPLFENPTPSEWGATSMTNFAREKNKTVLHCQWERAQVGPRFQQDDDQFTVSIPNSCAQGAELEALIDRIRRTVRSQQAGRFSGRETLADRTELHFLSRGPGSYIVTLMWESGEVPELVAVWKYNEGRRYQSVAWDSDMMAPTVHPSRLPPEQQPKYISASDSPPRLRKAATVEEALDWLLTRLQAIGSDYPEVTDTAIRDQVFDLLKQGFLQPDREARIPKRFGMDAKDADLKIHRVLSSFIKIATPAADARGLSPEERLALINQRPFDEFLGHCKSI